MTCDYKIKKNKNRTILELSKLYDVRLIIPESYNDKGKKINNLIIILESEEENNNE